MTVRIPKGTPSGDPGDEAQSLLDAIGGTSKRPPPITARKHKDSVQRIDKYDREDLAGAIESIKEFRLARQRLCNVAENTGGHLTSDTFFEFFKVEAKLRGHDEMDARFLLNLAVEEELTKTPEFDRLHRWTEGDIVGASLAFADIEPLLEQLFDKAQKNLEEKVKAVEEADEELGKLKGTAADLEEMIKEWSEGGIFDPEGIGGAQDFLDELEKGIAGCFGQLTDAEAELEGGIAGAIRGSLPGLRDQMGESADDAQRLEESMFGFGQEPGAVQRLSATERIALAKRLTDNERMKKLTEMIGAMRRLAEVEQTRKINGIPEEVFDIGFGNELSRLLPAEYHNLIRPQTKLDFYRRYQEKKLMEYKMRGHEHVGKGGIVMAVDGSYSMQGQPEIWSKAVAGAMMAIAREQDRSFFGIQFGSRSECRLFDFRKPEDMSINKVLDFMEFFFAGGTDFERPLRECLKVLQEENANDGAVKGDIVFVTDGQCFVSPAFMEMFKAEQERLGFRVFGVAIGGRRDAEPLASICDGNVVTITDLLSGEDMRSFFKAI